MMIIDNKYEIGQIVYLVTDQDQKRRIVSGIKVCKGGELIYELQCCTEETFHYEFEMSDIENVEIKLT